ncbi:mpv17-like protein 2 [Megachile rotundata]|uniref:mpv17-like protein 2 n=1 Tax=Megachile rotundata TaxID=143995 RepID=UPI000258DC76|nr:PREDICTED: mpv17-like protein 2 [Megachile rotundata]XP_012138128.1 PREDICTED: mpv17-like protein 2 [Megachile rotundata]
MNITKNISALISRVSTIKEQLFSPKYLLYTNVAISISLSATGDVLEQQYEILKNEWDKWSLHRTRNMAISGMSIGIVCHYWYKYLDAKIPGRTITVVLKKVVIDQLVCSPLCIAMFFLTLGILEKSSWSELKTEIINKAHKLYVAEWVIWPPAQIFNFYCLPSKYRVLYDNTISLGYDVYTSQVKHNNLMYNSH